MLEIPVVGAENAPNLIAFLEQEGAEIVAPPDDPEAALLSGDVAVVGRVEGSAEDTDAGHGVEVYASGSVRRARPGAISGWPLACVSQVTHVTKTLLY